MSEPPVYDVIGRGYAEQRRPDPRIAAAISAALGDAVAVLNVGAGAGSYEPTDRQVVALERSAVMIAQRSPESAPIVQGRGESLPFTDAAFDAVFGVLTLHHWSNQVVGLRECARVARRRVVFFTWDPGAGGFWLTQQYLPQFMVRDHKRFPSIEVFAAAFGSDWRVEALPVSIPRDCVDGFLGAYWARPAAYLDPRVRSGMSSFDRIGAEDGLARLRSDLADGTWNARNGHLLALESLEIGYRIVVGQKKR